MRTEADIFIILTKHLRWIMVPLYILMVACLNVKGQKVFVDEKVSAYGQTLTLLCKFKIFCNHSVGWEVWDPDSSTIFIDVRHVNIGATAKYGSEARSNGYTLNIRNLTRDDLNKSYTCNCKFTRSEKLFLYEYAVFTNETSSVPPGKHSHALITGLIVVVVLLLAVVIVMVMIIIIYRLQRKRDTPRPIRQETFLTEQDRQVLSENADEFFPSAIRRMGDEKIEEYRNLLKKGKEKRYYVKIYFLGKQGVGKTSLMRRLLNEDIEDVESTDGLDIVKRCKICIHDGKWIVNFTDDKIFKESDFASCIMVDFAGEKEYYITHQTFLTANAVFLLTNSLLDEDVFSDTIPDEEKIGFWWDNIHCYATKRKVYIEQEQLLKSNNPPDKEHQLMSANKEHEEDPPVIVVCTHASPDDLKATGNLLNLDDQVRTFKRGLLNVLTVNNRKKHMCGDIEYLSNLSGTSDDFNNLRTRIYDAARMLPDWGKELPKHWIEMEGRLDNERKHRKIVTFTDVKYIATTKNENFQNDDEIVFFLNYQHLIGNIIFFEDEKIRDLVILQPNWLVDAFKCLVCADKFRSITEEEIWKGIEDNGEIDDKNINELLSKIPETFDNKLLVGVMEKFDILVQDRNSDNTNFTYVIPSMIKREKPESNDREYKRLFGKGRRSAWLCVRFEFLPPVLYNHLVVRFMRDNRFSRDELWHGMCVFNRSDTNNTQKLVICKLQNTITFQFVLYDDDESFLSNPMSENAQIILKHIKNVVAYCMSGERYGMEINYRKQLMCSFHFDSLNQAVDIENLRLKPKFVCKHDGVNEKHNTEDDVYSLWTKNVEIFEVVHAGENVILDTERSVKRFRNELTETEYKSIKENISILEEALQPKNHRIDKIDSIQKEAKELKELTEAILMRAYNEKMSKVVTNARTTIHYIKARLDQLSLTEQLDEINPHINEQIEKINILIENQAKVAPESLEYATSDLKEMADDLFKVADVDVDIEDISPSLKQQTAKIKDLIKHTSKEDPESIEYATSDLRDMVTGLFKEDTGTEIELHVRLLPDATSETSV